MSKISSLCRTCMTNVIDSTDKDVYSCNIFESEGLAEKLVQCSNMKIQPYDEYPPHVCNTCCINILDFCEFQEMCRESLEKFSKMLKKQIETERFATNVLDDNDIDMMANTIELRSDSEEESTDNEMILGDTFIGKPKATQNDVIEIKSDHDSDYDNDPLSGAKDSVIFEAINIARRGTVENAINGDHNYGQFGKTNVVISEVGSGDKNELELSGEIGELSHNEDNRGVEFSNTVQTINSVNKTAECNSKIIENVIAEDESVEQFSTEIVENDFFEDLPDFNESFSDMNVLSPDNSPKTISTTLDFNNTSVTNIISTENTFPDHIYLKDDTRKLGNYSEEHHVVEDCILKDQTEDIKTNKTQLGYHDCKKEEDCIFKGLLKHKNTNTQPENDDCDKDEECIFEDQSEDEEHDKKRLDYVEEDEANEDYLFASPSEDEVVYSDSDNAVFDPKTKTYKTFYCDLCPQTFILEQRLLAHKRRHQGLKGYPCPRENCQRSYERLIDLRQHLDDHNGVPRQSFKCDVNNCGILYTSKSGLALHLRRYHNQGPAVPTRTYVCETCGKIYHFLPGFQKHQYTHVDESLWPFHCDVEGCTKKFRSKDNYKIHQNRHYGIKPYACMYCDKRFCASTNLHAHQNFHTLEKTWTCSFCPKVCYTPANLRTHIRRKHENHPAAKFPCRYCNKVLSSQPSRKSHEMRHTGEKAYVCKTCGRGFTQPQNLKKHKETHLPLDKRKRQETAKKFYCSICNRGLSTPISLKYHEMTHSGEKPFECDACGVKFRYQSNLMRHNKQKLCKKSKTATDKDTADKT